MAIEYINASFINRSSGHNALAAAAYRANEKLYCEQTGKTFDYENKNDCVFKTILLPESAYVEGMTEGNHPFLKRETLWNAVEAIENTHNRRASAQLAMELKIALPKELSREHQIGVLQSFIHEHYVDKHGVAADVCLHDKGDGNPHAHVMLTFRKIEGMQLSRTKVRTMSADIKKSAQGYFCVKDGLNKVWRDCQNAYFKAHDIDLRVDEGYVIPTVHEGHHRAGRAHHEQVKKNAGIKAANHELAKADHAIILQTLSSRQSVFTERDIKSLVFKMTAAEEDAGSYQKLLDRVMASESLVALGYAASGHLSYTTRETYSREVHLGDMADSLTGASFSSVKTRVVDRLSKAKTLNAEQSASLKTIVQAGRLVCVVGIAGTGKTHMLGAVKSAYEESGIVVRGTALAGKAASSLQDGAGIPSQTLDKILTCAEYGREASLPPVGSVVVLDEAGMVGLDKFHDLLALSQKRDWKLVVVGDPEQLQPIARGAPFRAVLERSGFCLLSDVMRQRDVSDRAATLSLAEGRVGEALTHYYDKGAIVLDREPVIRAALLSDYQQLIAKNPIAETLIFAFRCDDVAMLNACVRDHLKSVGRLSDGHTFTVKVGGALQRREFSVGDRVIFLDR